MHQRYSYLWTVATLFLLLSLPVAASACGRDAPEPTPNPTAEQSAKKTAGSAEPATAGDTLAAAGRTGLDGSRRLALGGNVDGALRAADDDDEKESKYWGGVEFGPEQFDEMQEYITQEYIEEEGEQARGYISAANHALSLRQPASG